MSSLEPTLTEENKMSRMELEFLFIDENNTSKFENIDTIPTKNGRELVEKWVVELKDKFSLDQTGRGCCLVRTQHSFCTQQVRYVGITEIVILFGLNLCAKSRDK